MVSFLNTKTAGNRWLRWSGAVLILLLGAPLWTAGPLAAAPSGKPILIGASIAQSGGFAKASHAQLTAYRLAAEIVNQQGGVLGRPVKLVVYDDQSNPSQGVVLYRRLIYKDKVDLLLGPFSSGVTLAVAPIVEQAKIPMVAPQAGDPHIYAEGRRYVFGVLPSGENYLTGGLELAKAHGIQKIALIYQDVAFPNAAAEGVRNNVKRMNLSIVLDESYPEDTTNFTTLMSKAKRQGAELLIGGGYIEDDIAIVKAARAVDYSPKMITLMIAAADPNFYKSLGQDAEFVTGDSSWEPFFKTPGNAEFIQRYKAKYGEEPYYDTAASYAGFMLLVQAIRAVGRLDRQAIRNWLSTTTTETVFGKYAVNKNGLQIGKEQAIFQWQKGRREIVWPSRIKTADLIVPSSFWKR